MERRITTVDDFNHWVADMDDALRRFTATLPDDLRQRLDLSPASLDVLERWLLDRYPSVAAMTSATEALTVDGAARYIGETLRKSIGGHWDIRLDDPKYAYFNRPILTGFEPQPTPFCPQAMASTAVDRRTGHLLRGQLERKREKLAK